MVFNSEVEETIFKCNIDFSEEEYSNLLEYAEDYMPEDRKNELMIEWALVNLLERLIDEDTSNTD